ncbi:hypothetical protein DL768_003364 [Monosporascus sp. mg162]|nr:hypothetical protein DL768_003364 [Monosporascus sp. mg162]
MAKCDCKCVCTKETQKDKKHCKDCADHYDFAWKHEKPSEKCDDTKDQDYLGDLILWELKPHQQMSA